MSPSIPRAVATALLAAVLSSVGGSVVRAQAPPEPVYVKQGAEWTPADKDKRHAFYAQDQGSQLMPLAWLRALRQQNGQPFLADALARYGYLPNPASPVGLPVGFTAAGSPGGEVAGMTCAACHTRQIVVNGTAYRIDGGPAIVDFQSFLTDLDAAVGALLNTDANFRTFARSVLGEDAADGDGVTGLNVAVTTWYDRFHTLMSRALPPEPWGPARLDAVGMIFNRLTGLDIGPPPNTMIPNNIRRADAPTRYPFLWNAPRQDKTQWPGFADNGDDVLALSRNLGEVFGVFGSFAPKPEWYRVLGYDYLANNSANFDGLRTLENFVKQIGPPQWPWALDVGLIAQGKVLYARSEAEGGGGCKGCHWPEPGTPRFFDDQTWKTPVMDVGTDSREHAIMGWTVESGVLTGAVIPFVQPEPLKKEGELAFKVLANSVLGSIIQSYFPILMSVQLPESGLRKVALKPLALPPQLRQLKGAFPTGPEAQQALTRPKAQASFPYESRVLQGIWAAAPYLHNGSVPTLAELLKAPADRKASFKVGPNYDIVDVGLAVDQTAFDYTLKTTGCEDRDSGNSRCGHDYGTKLTPEQKKALIEYLKTL